MDKNVCGVFDDVCSDLSIDQTLLRKLARFQVGFVNKNEEHIEFFGGHVLGVHRVRFTNEDNDRWFDEILEAGEHTLEERLHALPDINPDFNISSDVFNLSCVWLTHAIFRSSRLSVKEKEDSMINVMLILNYRYITSRIVNHFRFPADPGTAEATYAALSYKFAIKQLGTWQAVLRARSVDIIATDSIHRHCIEKMDDDLEVVNMLNDTQGRIRDMVKNIYTVFIETHNSGMKITTTSEVVEFDGSEILKDKTHGLVSYKQYLRSSLTNETSFIKEELVNVVEKIVNTVPDKLFRKTLSWLATEYSKNTTGIIDQFVDEVLTHSFGYLEDNRSILRNTVNLEGLVSRLRGVYMSSRSTDPVLLEIRDKAEEIVKLATGNKNKNIIASVRTAMMLYIICRTFTRHRYG